MTRFNVLDDTGHTERSFTDDPESRAAGEALFNELRAKGFTMFDTSDPLVGKPAMRAYDPAVEEITPVPQYKGG